MTDSQKVHQFPAKEHRLGMKGFPPDSLSIALLFFEETRNPFCDLDLLRLVLYKVNSPWDLEIIDGGDHSFRVPKSRGLSSTAVHQRLLDKTVNAVQS